MVVLCWDTHIHRYVCFDAQFFSSFPSPVVYDESYRLFFPTCVFLEGEGWFVYCQGNLIPHDAFIMSAREHMIPVYPNPPCDAILSAGNNDICVIDRSHPLFLLALMTVRTMFVYQRECLSILPRIRLYTSCIMSVLGVSRHLRCMGITREVCPCVVLAIHAAFENNRLRIIRVVRRCLVR